MRAHMDGITPLARLLVGITLLLLLVLLPLGCADAESAQVTLDRLERGGARGHLILTAGGPPGVGASNHFYLGTPSATLAFDGDIDFSKTGATGKTRGAHGCADGTSNSAH